MREYLAALEAVEEECKDGTLSRSDFQWNAKADEYRCPKDKPLRSTGNTTSADTLIYRSSVYDCVGGELKSLCCPNTTHRKIARQVDEAARDVAREIAESNKSGLRTACLAG